jgi:growth factor-regulated tyrosine kinase substrate
VTPTFAVAAAPNSQLLTGSISIIFFLVYSEAKSTELLKSCRNCGQTFCNDCSAKRIALAHLGITEEVRVCDGCHMKILNKNIDDKPRSRQSSERENSRDELARKEEEELERAIAASLESSGQSKTSKKEKSKKTKKHVSFKEDKSQNDDDEDEDLKAAIEASLRDSKPLPKHPEAAPIYPLVSSKTNDLYIEEPNSAYLTGDLNGSRPTVAAQVQPIQQEFISAREIENLKLFTELVERTDADVALRGIQSLNFAQLQVTSYQFPGVSFTNYLY